MLDFCAITFLLLPREKRPSTNEFLQIHGLSLGEDGYRRWQRLDDVRALQCGNVTALMRDGKDRPSACLSWVKRVTLTACP